MEASIKEVQQKSEVTRMDVSLHSIVVEYRSSNGAQIINLQTEAQQSTISTEA